MVWRGVVSKRRRVVAAGVVVVALAGVTVAEVLPRVR
jgi:hypothetical protein